MIKPSGADGRSELSQDGTQAPITKLAVVKEPRTQLNNSPIPVQVNGTTTGAKESTETTTKIVLCVPADAQADNELPHTVVPQASVIDVDADEQNLSPVQLDAVVGKLLNDAQFIEQVARKMIAGQSMPPRQRVHTSANGARSVLVINYKSSLIREFLHRSHDSQLKRAQSTVEPPGYLPQPSPLKDVDQAKSDTELASALENQKSHSRDQSPAVNLAISIRSAKKRPKLLGNICSALGQCRELVSSSVSNITQHQHPEQSSATVLSIDTRHKGILLHETRMLHLTVLTTSILKTR